MIGLSRLFQRTLPSLNVIRATFSQYFADRDKSEILIYYDKKVTDTRYTKMKYEWQEDLKKKKSRRARKLEADSQKSPTLNSVSKFVVHNPREEVEVPCNPDQVFAVVDIAGRQFKVTKDDLVVSEWIKELDINQTIELSRVLMVGTKDYTSIGRPFVESARVVVTVEQQALTEKEIVLKKLRRKRFRKSQGHRQNVTLLRINSIRHDVNQDELNRAVSLI